MTVQQASPTGRILNIQHFCVDDGPGIRTTVFFKGCPLRCVWCHNPESHRSESEILYRADRCRACGACVAHCPQGAHTLAQRHQYDRERCLRCGKCATVCPVGALEQIGESRTVEEIMDELLSDRPFYAASHGGVTLSGGEPTAQPDFCEALLRACRREGLHTCMETCAWCSRDVLLRMIPHTDLFLVDFKLTDDRAHKTYTGVSNQQILENLALLRDRRIPVILRCPLIPDINATFSHYDFIADLANSHSNIIRIDLEPYHPLGVGKSEALGRPAAYRNPDFLDPAVAQTARDRIAARTATPVLISGKG